MKKHLLSFALLLFAVGLIAQTKAELKPREKMVVATVREPDTAKVYDTFWNRKLFSVEEIFKSCQCGKIPVTRPLGYEGDSLFINRDTLLKEEKTWWDY